MTQGEKLEARLKGVAQTMKAEGLLKQSGMFRIEVAIVGGEILFWLPPEFMGELEGLKSPETIPEAVKIG